MRTLLSATAIGLIALPASAQELPQSGDAFFQAGQAAIEARLSQAPITTPATNVILFVADGMGVGTNYAIRLHAGQEAGGLGDDYVLPYEAFPNSALVKTYSANGQTPDSAPTATALNSGIKTKNDMINIMETVAVGDCAAGAAAGTRTFAEIAAERGMSVGVVTTTRVTHATPAAVYARTVNRDWEDDSAIPEGCDQPDIAAQLVAQMEAGVIDLVLGGGRGNFLPEGTTGEEEVEGRRTDGRNLIEEVRAMGGQYAWNTETFLALTAAQAQAPVLGLFEGSHMQYEADRTDEPSLAEMTRAAIERLSANEGGYYLMVEAGRVDHASHDGNLYRTVTDGAAFADAVAAAVEMTSEQDTLIIVTADHEHTIAFNGYCGRGSSVTGLCMGVDEAGVENTGEPNLALDGKPYTVAGLLNGGGSILTQEGQWTGSRPDLTEEEATSPDYMQQALVPLESETHSGEDVPAFARGPWSHLVDGVMEQNEIFGVMMQAVNPGN